MSEIKPSDMTLGDLEILVLEYLWSLPDASVKEVHHQLIGRHETSVKTVQSAMERLYRKGLLGRSKAGHSYRYTARISKEELLGDLIHGLVGKFQSNSHSSAVAFLNAAESIDESTLDLLEAEIQKRRKERK